MAGVSPRIVLYVSLQEIGGGGIPKRSRGSQKKKMNENGKERERLSYTLYIIYNTIATHGTNKQRKKEERTISKEGGGV